MEKLLEELENIISDDDEFDGNETEVDETEADETEDDESEGSEGEGDEGGGGESEGSEGEGDEGGGGESLDDYEESMANEDEYFYSECELEENVGVSDSERSDEKEDSQEQETDSSSESSEGDPDVATPSAPATRSVTRNRSSPPSDSEAKRYRTSGAETIETIEPEQDLEETESIEPEPEKTKAYESEEDTQPAQSSELDVTEALYQEMATKEQKSSSPATKGKVFDAFYKVPLEKLLTPEFNVKLSALNLPIPRSKNDTIKFVKRIRQDINGAKKLHRERIQAEYANKYENMLQIEEEEEYFEEEDIIEAENLKLQEKIRSLEKSLKNKDIQLQENKNYIESLEEKVKHQDKSIKKKDSLIRAKDVSIRNLRESVEKLDAENIDLLQKQDEEDEEIPAPQVGDDDFIIPKVQFSKAFTEMSIAQRTRKLKPLQKCIASIAEDNNITSTQILGFLQYKENYIHNRELGNLGKDISEGRTDLSKCNISNKTGAYWWSLGLGRNTMNKLRRSSKTVTKVPTEKDIKNYIDEEILNVKENEVYEVESDGCYVGLQYDLEKFLKQYFKNFIIGQKEKGEPLPEGGKFNFKCKSGYDTSKHNKYQYGDAEKSKNKVANSDIGFMDMTILQICNADQQTDEYKFTEKTPNSDKKNQILALLEIKESDQIVTDLYLDMQTEMNRLKEEGISIMVENENKEEKQYTFFPEEVCWRNDG